MSWLIETANQGKRCVIQAITETHTGCLSRMLIKLLEHFIPYMVFNYSRFFSSFLPLCYIATYKLEECLLDSFPLTLGTFSTLIYEH